MKRIALLAISYLKSIRIANLKFWKRTSAQEPRTLDMHKIEDEAYSLSPTQFEKIISAAKTPIEATAVAFNAILATNFAVEIDRWMREEFATGAASVYDKSMDAARNTMNELGGDHRLFDGSHDLFGAWKATTDALPDDTMLQAAGGYLSAVWKDVVTPMGLPVMTLDRDQFEAFAEHFEVNREWLRDAASFTATEGAGAIVGVLAVALNWSETDVPKFSLLVGRFGISAAVGANPFLVIIAIVALARSFNEARYKEEYGSVVKGVLKGGVGTGAFLGAASLVAGPAWIGLMVGLVCAVLTHKGYEKGEEVVKDVSWSDIGNFIVAYIKSWSGDKAEKFSERMLQITARDTP